VKQVSQQSHGQQPQEEAEIDWMNMCLGTGGLGIRTSQEIGLLASGSSALFQITPALGGDNWEIWHAQVKVTLHC
jgi:hypothetical protein